MASIDIDHIAQPIDSYLEMASRWELPQTLMGGTIAMREAGEEYLPRWPQETREAYYARLRQSVLYNAFRKSVNGLTGRVFSKPVQLGDDVPPNIVDYCENIDLTGRGLQPFMRDVMVDGMTYGLSHILVDTPSNTPETLEDERNSGFRPYFVHVKAHDLIGWRARIINGKYTVIQARIRETYLKEAGIYAEIPQERIRVLEPGRYQLWDSVGKNNEYQLVAEGETGLDYVPLVTFYANRTGHMLADPPLEDLAYLNAQHWQSSSDQHNILHVARVPLLHFAGFPADFGDEDGEASVSNAFVGPENSKVGFIEHTGKAVDAGAAELSDLEEKMQIMGMQMLVPKSGNQTATAKSIDAAEANSELQAIALNLQDAIEQAFMITADYLGLGPDSGGSITVNTDFGINMRDAADLDALIKARAQGDISRETLWSEFKRRGLLVDEFDGEVETERLMGNIDALDVGRMDLNPSAVDAAILKALEGGS